MFTLMSLNTILNQNLVTVNLAGTTKREVIENLLDMLMTTGKISSREEALRCILEREEKMSTGIEDGVAIPHGKCGCVSEMVAAAGLIREGMDFQSLDGRPSRLFILTLSPAHQSGPHIRFLSSVSVLLKDDDLRERIFNAESDEEFLSMLNE